MSNDTVMTVTVKGIGDFSDVVSNVGSVQKALTKLKLPDKLGDNLNKNITNFYKEYEKYQKKISEGIKTQGDYNQVEKSLNNMRNLYQAIGKDAQKLTELDMKDILNLDTGEFKKIMNEMTSVMKQIGSVKIDTSPFTKAFKDIQGITKNSKIVGEDGLLNKIIGSINTGQIAEAKKQLQELQNYAKKVAPRTTADGKQAPGTLSPEKYQQLTSAINSMNGAVSQAETAINPLIEKHNNLQKELDETKQKAAQSIKNEFKGYNQASGEVEKLTDSLRRMHEEEFNFNREAQNIDRQIQSYFGLSQMIRKVGDIARDAFSTVKELDKAMTETAVVTNFSVGDMWDMLPTYTQQANQLGSTIRDVYEAATLYYQQGLNTNQAMSLANETLKMARIAGLDAAEATNMMTAALRGFNMEINQQSAQKINDIYSELAAITASDTKEIGSAMERTASIANSANMEFATTSAFLAQMIETTREAPENLGTAMKTIVARFQEMKQDPTKLVDSEGVAMDANKVDKALKTIGVNLMNTKGEFRDLDDVFLDISQRWDSLTQGQQRYIATIAAGSRQQSRFIAMMSNYERTMELVDAANNSAGASQRQFEKTLDSMEAKLNKLKNAWDQFTMGLMNNQILKFSVDALTEGFTIVNKFIDILGRIPPKPFEGITKSVLTLVTTLGMLNLGKKASRGLVMGGAGWFKGEKGFLQGFSEGWGNKNIEAGRSGTQAGMTWSQFAAKAINSSSGEIKQAMHNAMQLNQTTAPVAIENELRLIFQGLKETSNGFGLEGHKSADRYIEAVLDSIRKGERSIRSAIETVFAQANKEVTEEEMAAIEQQIQSAAKSPVDFDKTSTDFENLTQSATKAGTAIQQFGFALQGTPLEGFGNTLIKIGQLMDSTATLAKTLGKKLGEAFKAAKAAEAGKGISTFFQTLLPGLTKLVAAHPILAAIVAIITAIGVAAMAVAHHNKKAFETIQNAAAKASEAYDSAKQETSELADAIEQVKTNADAFDSLVVGTAAFNEQLVTANQQIMELINKYPMLNDYLTTDKNGLMHISDEGLDAVKDYQKQLQANASALNLIQTADLNSVEAQQKAKQMRKTKGTDTLESLAQRKQEADLIEQQAEAQQQMAKLNAVNTALVDKEIGNREKVSAILADQYDSRREAISLEGESIHDLKQEYADFYGYKYDKSTKKMTDIEGNEIDVDKATVKDAVKDIRILTDIEVDGKSLDSMINHIDSAFSQALGSGFEESESLFSDILSDNIDIEDDLLQNLLTNPDKLQNAVDSLSEKEIAAVLGVSADAVEQAPDKYKDELTNKLTEKATNIAETQAQSYADLAAMLAQTTSADVSQLIDASGQATTNAQKANQQAIKEQLEKLTSEQKNTLSSIGNILNENAGAETMRTFIKQATDIYTKGTKESITALDTIIKDVNWSSPTARLKAYNDMINSTDKDVQNLGDSLRKSSESSNLLGEAFEEFYDSSDFQEMAENMDKFADSSGKLNASSIQEMAKECNSLNNLLDTGAISAGGVAAALNAMGRDGNITILDLNENLLKFLSTANQLDDVLSEAHSLIENFDWGVDTGESEDFAKDSSKKWKELYDNGEFGNQQLENYAKFVLGQERWNKELEASGGNIETALDNMSKDILKYSDGFDQAWEDMASSSSDKFKDFHYSEDEEDIIWETNGRTTQQLVEDLAEARGITQEWAKLMVEDFANYSYDFKTELASNDFAAALKNGDYITNRTGKNGEVNMTQNELATLAAAQNKTEEEILSDIQKYGKVSEDQLNVIKTMDEKGNLLMGSGDIASLNTQYSQAELGKDTDKSWISQYTAKTRQGQSIEGSTDLKTAISGAIADGFQAEQATEMARAEAYQAFKDGAQVFYDGVELNEQDLADSQAFAEKIAEITENSRWNAVGEAIAQGYISYIQGTENPSNTDNNNQGSNWTSAKDGGEKTTNVDFSSSTPTEDPKEQAKQAAKEKFNSWIRGLIEGTNTPAEDPKIAAAEKSKENWTAIWQKVKEGLSSGEGAEDPKVEAAKKAKENWKNIWDSVKQSFTSTPTSDVKPKQPTQSQSQQPTVESTETTLTVHTEDSELDATKTKIDTVIQAASQPQTLTITANTGKSTNTALASINKIKDATKKTNTIKVNAQVKGKENVSNLSSIIKNVKAKTVKVTASVSGANKVSSLKTEINNLKNKDVYITTHKKTVNDGDSGAKGINNKISYHSLPLLGSMAKGAKYGRLGPKGKGGLTLTGEKGYEIAWLPSESRSMILGANGPQMINLPADAVVYTHEQSEDILKKRQTIDAGSHAGRKRKNTTSGSGTSKGSKGSTGKGKTKKKKQKKSKKTNINNFSTQEVIRFNIDQIINATNAKIAKTEKEIEEGLSKIGGTYDSIANTVNNQLSSLQQIKTKNEDLKKSYEAQLKEYRGRQAIVSWTNSKGNSKNRKINIADYLNKDGSVNQQAIAAIATRAEREAVFKEVSSAQSLVDGIQKAQDAIDDATNKMAELGKKISETFFQWENELTEIYDLTQRINNEVSLTDRFASQVQLELSKLGSGFGDVSESIGIIRKVLIRSNTTIQEQIKNQQQMVNARRDELDAAYSIQDELDRLNFYKNQYKFEDEDTKKATIEWAESQVTAARLGQKYVKNVKEDVDGSIQYEIDWEGFKRDQDKSPVNKATYEDIKQYLDNLNDTATEYNSSIKDGTDFLKQTYDALREYQDFIGDFEETLIDGMETLEEDNTEELKNLSDTLSDTLKDLFDEVKKKLDERRQREDNLKTEQDISRKQQRLAMLRADTSGGHQVEIAQLQKEINDAQQSYQRDLEDQLLDRLQQQADEAQQQRERLIALSEGQLEIAASNNKELVDMWLKDPVKFQNEIKEAWMAANNADEKGEIGKFLLENDFKSDFTNLVTAVEQSGFKDGIEGVESNTSTLVQLLTDLNSGLIGRENDKRNKDSNAQTDLTERNTESLENKINRTPDSIKKLKDAGVSVSTLKLYGFKPQELLEGGYTGLELYKGGFTNAADYKASGVSYADAKSAGFSNEALHKAGYQEGTAGWAQELDTFIQKSNEELASLQKDLSSANNWLNINKNWLASAQTDLANAKAKYELEKRKAQAARRGIHVANFVGSPSTVGITLAQSSVDMYQNSVNEYTTKVNQLQKEIEQKQNAIVAATNKRAGLQFKTGGIADYTGPAWLDGTPSKPELVLNARDTQNFLALRDVLSKVIGSTNSITNSYGGDNIFEINVNVDKIEKDYDVDRVIEKVKKEITKGAGYRNVTQVRNFR